MYTKNWWIEHKDYSHLFVVVYTLVYENVSLSPGNFKENI